MNVRAAPRTHRAAFVVVMVFLAAGLTSCSPDRGSVDAGPCSSDAAHDSGTTKKTVTVDGEERGYLLHIPAGFDGTTRLPVVFLFHGLGGTNSAILATSQMDEEADRRGFVVVAPQGLGAVAGWDYRTPASAEDSDLAFVDTLVKDVQKRACVDPERRYAAGFSNGSLLTFALACSDSEQFAAFGGVSASTTAARCGNAPARPIIYFHGTADEVIPYAGAATVFGRFPPVALALTTWADHDGCEPGPDVTAVSKTVDKHDWSGCNDGSELQAYVVDEGGHRWPGGLDLSANASSGRIDQSIDATELMWEFFLKYPDSGQ